MILDRQTSTWPLQEERPDLAASWFDHLRVQTREALEALEGVAHSGVDSKVSVQELVDQVNRLRQQVRFNRSLASAMHAKREKLGLSTPPAVAATITHVFEDLQRFVDQADNTAEFVAAVAAEADYYKKLAK